MNTLKLKLNLNWALIFFYILFTVYADISDNSLGAAVPIITIGTLFLFAALHGMTIYSVKDFIAFLLICFVISNFFEDLGVVTGFPFGPYHYTDNMGPKLFYVPITVGIAYFSMGYLSWVLAHAFLGTYQYIPHSWNKVIVPIVATFIMVSWDVVMDPLSSTFSHDWIWHKGGGYFGVPFQNFMGWYLVVYSYNQAFSLYLNRFASSAPLAQMIQPKIFWCQAALMYAVVALEYPFLSLFGENTQIVDQTGKIWWTGDMYHTAAIISIYTMIFIAFFAVVRIYQRSTDQKSACDGLVVGV